MTTWGFTPSDDLFDEPTVEDGELDGYSTEEHEDDDLFGRGTISRPMGDDDLFEKEETL